jgi:integrase
MTRTRGSGHVFRPGYVDRHGVSREASTWAIGYYDRRKGRNVKEYGFETEAAAEAKLRGRLVDLSRGRRVGPTIERVSFEDMVKLITDDYTNNRRDTSARVAQSIAHLKLSFGGDRAIDITSDRVTAYTSSRLKEGAAPATVNRELAALKRMFRLAVRGKGISLDLVPYVAMLKEDNVRKGFIEPEQFKALLKHLGPALGRIVTVAYVTGWRVPSEVLTREWRHVDLDAGWLRLEPGETKNGRGRMFPIDMDPRLRAALEDARADADARKKAGAIAPWVFRRKGGERIASFRKDWDAACTAAGVPGRLLHDLRRSAARNMLRAGLSTRAVMELAGWETESMLRRYAIVDETMLNEAAEKHRVFLGVRLGANSGRTSSGGQLEDAKEDAK